MVNTAPTIGNFGAGVSLLEQQFGYLDIDGDFVAVDAELNAMANGFGDWTGASLDIARAGGANADDLFNFNFDPGYSVSGNQIFSGFSAIATFTSGGGVLHIDFAIGSFSHEVQTILRAITYQNTSDSPPATPYNLEFVLSDGDPSGALSSTQALAISITPQNDFPLVTGGLAAVIDEGSLYTVTAADLNYSDPDNPASDITYTVYPGASQSGSLLVNGVPATTFSPADVDAGLVQFQHDGNDFSGTAAFFVTVADAVYNPYPTTYQVSFDITPVNDSPTLTGSLAATLAPGTQIQLTTGMVFGSDLDDDPSTLTFSVRNLQNIAVFSVFNLSTPITSFSGFDLLNGWISIRHSSFDGPVGFDIAVEDGNADGSAPVPQPFTVTLDTSSTPSVPDLDDADDTGVVGDNITANSTGLTFTANLPFGADVVSFYDDLRLDGTDNDGDTLVDEDDELTLLGEAFDSGGGVYVLDNVSLSAGTHSIRSKLGTYFDNGPSLGVLTVVIDPDVENLDLAAADDTGVSNTDNITAQASGLTITGDTDAVAGETVTLHSVVNVSQNGIDDDSDGTIDETGEVSTTVLGSGLTDSSGGFSIDITLPEGVTQIAGQLGTGPLSPTITVNVDTTAPVLNALVMANGQIAVNPGDTLIWVQEIGDFTVMVDGNPATIASATEDSGSIILTLANPVTEGQTVQFAYDAAAGTPNSITDLAGNAASSVPLTAIPNGSTIDITPPSLTYASVQQGGQGIVLVWNDNVAASAFEPGDFSILINGVATNPITVVSGEVFGLGVNTVLLQFDPTINESDDILGPVIYTAGAGTPGSIIDDAGNPAGDQSIAITPNTPPSWDASSYAVTVSETDFTNLMVSIDDGQGGEIIFNYTGAFVPPVGYADIDLFGHHSLGFALTSATWDPLDGPPQASPASTGMFIDPSPFGSSWLVEGGPSAYEFLSYGETVVLQFTATVNDGHPGGTDTLPITITIEGVNTQLSGTSFDDLAINGTTSGDDIHALAGDDTVNGGSGHDRVWGDDGDDALNGGSGIDTLYGGAGEDDLDGGSGNDTLFGGDNADALYGGSGVDYLLGGTGDDRLFGEGDGDHLWGGGGADQHTGGDGIDYARYDDANYGNLTLRLDGGANVGAAAVGDTYTGIEGLVGGAGNDTIYGDGANNNLFGSAGGDTIYGQGGVDYLFGGVGGDVLDGGAGGDHLWGGDGADQHIGGNDSGIDYARYDDANYGNLTLRLDNAALNVGAAAAGDTYSGVEGLVGGVGSDVVVGNSSANYLFGGGGSDYIDAREGNDYMNGGADADRFVFATALGAGNVDTIADFTHLTDDIVLRTAIFSAVGPILAEDELAFGTAAADSNDYIIYNSASGALYYDSNGNLAGGITQFATVTAGTTLTFDDFIVA